VEAVGLTPPLHTLDNSGKKGAHLITTNLNDLPTHLKTIFGNYRMPKKFSDNRAAFTASVCWYVKVHGSYQSLVSALPTAAEVQEYLQSRTPAFELHFPVQQLTGPHHHQMRPPDTCNTHMTSECVNSQTKQKL